MLEEPCSDCVKILSIKNNGDSTIDLTVQIRHPKPGHAEFTGFDVKGILMFNGSYEMPSLEIGPPYPDPFRISWRLRGDAEVLNPDGYTVRWSPSYNSGSSAPLLNYWPGKYSHGTPTANINAYLDFYSDENRHMFANYSTVNRVYHIYLPPGPVVAGYAVEACWEPPTKTPVIDPANDFPTSANQDEPYHYRLVLNNDQPITSCCCCGENIGNDCPNLWLEVKQWGGYTVNAHFTVTAEPYDWHIGINPMPPCETGPDTYSLTRIAFTWEPYWPDYDTDGYPDGVYRNWGMVYRYIWNPDGPAFHDQIAYTIYDVTVDQN
jgi:hypothetical protein